MGVFLFALTATSRRISPTATPAGYGTSFATLSVDTDDVPNCPNFQFGGVIVALGTLAVVPHSVPDALGCWVYV